MDSLKAFLQDLDLPCQEKLLAQFQPKTYQKADYFVQAGKTNHYLGFVEQGLFQYFYTREGDEITSYVAGKNSFITSLSSFVTQTPAKENIRALTESVVWQIHKKNLAEILQASESFKVFYIQLLEHQIVCIDDSRHNFICLNAEERYEKMLKEEPELLQQIPLQYLASMLGVTPRHLSRIRGNIR
jgi:CRP-like cAMP-binding protein